MAVLAEFVVETPVLVSPLQTKSVANGVDAPYEPQVVNLIP